MSTAVAERTVPVVQRPERVSTAPGRPTLDEAVSSAWAGLSAGAPVECAVCAGTMVPSPQASGGRCLSCASTLS